MRLLLPLIAGILFENYLPLPTWLIVASLLLFSSALVFIFFRKSNYHLRWFFGLNVYLIIFFTGCQLITLNTPRQFIFPELKPTSTVIAEIVKSPVEKNKSYQTVIEFKSLKIDNKITTIDGQAAVFIYKDSLSAKLALGDEIICNATFDVARNIGNPDEFDYKTFLFRKGICWQKYVKQNEWKLLSKAKGNVFLMWVDKVKFQLLAIYKKYGLKDQEFAVASALTIGYTDDLDKETMQTFSNTGAMHILSVSGLHVGVIYYIINQLLFFLNKFRRGKVIKAVLIITFLWFFAALAGMCPAILRSALMLTFVILADTLKRTTNIYNTLSISAFILLIWNPYNLFDVGFQLSYLAVASIVYFQRQIKNLYTPRNAVDKWFWELIAVSFAAQLGTFAISIYYFHQFPNYFLLTNMIAIPLSSFILFFGALLFAVSWLTPLATVVAWLLNFLVKSMNGSLNFIENLPFSVYGGVSINLIQLFLITIFILIVFKYFETKNKITLRIILVFAVLLLSIKIFSDIQKISQNKIIVYNTQGITNINFVRGNKSVILTSASSDSIFKRQQNVIKPNLIKLGVRQTNFLDLKKLKDSTIKSENWFWKNNFVEILGKRFFIFNDKNLTNNTVNKKFTIDVLVLANNQNIDIATLKNYFNFNMIVIDSSNSKNRRNNWISECSKQKIPVYSVSENGAFEMML